MPIRKNQQKFMGIVKVKEKRRKPSGIKFSKDAQDEKKNEEKRPYKKFASTKHKGLPMKKEILTNSKK